MDLSSLIRNKRAKLKPCCTIVTNHDGKRYEVNGDVVRELQGGLPFVVDTKPDLQIVEIVPGLFLSSQDPAASLELLTQYRIRHVLSVGIALSVKFPNISYHCLDLLDLPESDIFDAANLCVEIIESNPGEHVLVHCNAGVSRSPAVVIAYLILARNMTYEDAYEKVRSARQCAKPNEGFVRQLKSLAALSPQERSRKFHR